MTTIASEQCDLYGCTNPIHDCHGGEFYLCLEHWTIFIADCGFRGDGLPPFPMDPDDWWDALLALDTESPILYRVHH